MRRSYNSIVRNLRHRSIKIEAFELDIKPEIKQKRTKHPWTCKKCKTDFPTVKSLRAHRATHRKPDQDLPTYKYEPILDIYTCNTCSAEFSNQDQAENHVRKTHIETFSCDLCNLKFSKAYEFSCHMQQHSEDGKFKCPMCVYCTQRRTALSIHINRIHLHKFIYYCAKCGKGFNDIVLYKEHENEHLGVKPFVCVVCAKAFTFSKYLQLHQIRYHTVRIDGQVGRNQCPICLRMFARDNTLDNHMISRHSKGPRVKKHLCDICGKGFGAREKLKIHYRVHTGEKPYQCQYCHKSFIKRDYLVMHERIHTGEKPYKCVYCEKCFNQHAPWRIHMRGHTGERPYVCQLCNGGFVSKGAMSLHQKTCKGRV